MKRREASEIAAKVASIGHRSPRSQTIRLPIESTYAGAFGPKAATPEGREVLGRELSPIYWVRKDQPPVFIVHGDADLQVSITQAHRFLKRCNEVGATCEVFIREGTGHGGWQEMSDDSARMIEWFDLQLLGKQPAKPFGRGVKSGPSTPVMKPAAK